MPELDIIITESGDLQIFGRNDSGDFEAAASDSLALVTALRALGLNVALVGEPEAHGTDAGRHLHTIKRASASN